MNLKKYGPVAALAGAMCVMLGVAVATTGDNHAEEAQAMPKHMMPTEAHKAMMKSVGVWDGKAKFWMGGPDVPPLEADVVETVKALGDKWLVSEFKCDFDGMPFTGQAQIGYDPVKKKFIGTWIDSMSPFLQTMEGKYEADAKTATLMTQGRDVMDGKVYQSKIVEVWKDDDNWTFTMYRLMPDGGEMKTMHVEYKRRQNDEK